MRQADRQKERQTDKKKGFITEIFFLVSIILTASQIQENDERSLNDESNKMSSRKVSE